MLKTSVGPTFLFLCMFKSLAFEIFVVLLIFLGCYREKITGLTFSVFCLHFVLYFLSPRSERPEDWVPAEVVTGKHDTDPCNKYSNNLEVGEDENGNVDIFSIHSESGLVTQLNISATHKATLNSTFPIRGSLFCRSNVSKSSWN